MGPPIKQHLSGYIMSSDKTAWTKHPVRIDYVDVLEQWESEPTIAEIKAAKARLPIAAGHYSPSKTGMSYDGGANG